MIELTTWELVGVCLGGAIGWDVLKFLLRHMGQIFMHIGEFIVHIFD